MILLESALNYHGVVSIGAAPGHSCTLEQGHQVAQLRSHSKNGEIAQNISHIALGSRRPAGE
ncbi:hypothetical protein SB748_36530, partial [Rhizobium sp. SIMBA_035]